MEDGGALPPQDGGGRQGEKIPAVEPHRLIVEIFLRPAALQGQVTGAAGLYGVAQLCRRLDAVGGGGGKRLKEVVEAAGQRAAARVHDGGSIPLHQIADALAVEEVQLDHGQIAGGIRGREEDGQHLLAAVDGDAVDGDAAAPRLIGQADRDAALALQPSLEVGPRGQVQLRAVGGKGVSVRSDDAHALEAVVLRHLFQFLHRPAGVPFLPLAENAG